MKLLFRDNDIAVVVKAHGELSQSDKTGSESLIEILSAELGCTVYPIHRLDRPVSGVMVYALNKKSAASLSAQLAGIGGAGFSKEYIAAVSGIPEEQSGILTDYIYKDGSKNKSFVCSSERKGVKQASLEYEVIASYETSSLSSSPVSVIKIKLHTGRTHQIRVQFSSRGFPILGDGKYGSRVKFPSGIALSSVKLEFLHPSSGNPMLFEEENTMLLSL